jgi:hypothetical protein
VASALFPMLPKCSLESPRQINAEAIALSDPVARTAKAQEYIFTDDSTSLLASLPCRPHTLRWFKG